MNGDPSSQEQIKERCTSLGETLRCGGALPLFDAPIQTEKKVRLDAMQLCVSHLGPELHTRD